MDGPACISGLLLLLSEKNRTIAARVTSHRPFEARLIKESPALVAAPQAASFSTSIDSAPLFSLVVLLVASQIVARSQRKKGIGTGPDLEIRFVSYPNLNATPNLIGNLE